MQNGPLFWTTLVTIGVLLWLSSVGVWSHPVYRLFLMFVISVWGVWVARAPKER